jgi:hypothetical protein
VQKKKTRITCMDSVDGASTVCDGCSLGGRGATAQ